MTESLFQKYRPHEWSYLNLATVTTHDLPTVAGVALGSDGSDDMRSALQSVSEGSDPVVAVHRVVAESPAALCLVSTDDLAGMVERPNHPGTSNDEQPNWCRRLPCSVEALVEQEPGRTLIATGGAAPLHAGRIAQKLSIDTFVVPKGAGVGSAHGFLAAPVAYEAVHSHYMTLSKFDAATLNEIFARMRREAEEIVRLAPGYGDIVETRFADMRYRGQGHEITVSLPAGDFTAADREKMIKLYEDGYAATFGRRISAGVTYKYVQQSQSCGGSCQNLLTYSVSTSAFDVGAQAVVGDQLAGGDVAAE